MKRMILLLSWFLAVNAGAQTFTIDTISDAVFQRMAGKSYKADCTIARSDLRYLRLSYVDAEGREHVGELICNKAIANDLKEIFRMLYMHSYPIERMELIDQYEADDERSMRANNTCCFNFRKMTGSNKLSKHAQGMAVDLNPLYNPYIKRRTDGTLFVQPATATKYSDRSKQWTYQIKKGDLCYRLFTEHGFQWGGNWHSLKDYQHFEK